MLKSIVTVLDLLCHKMFSRAAENLLTALLGRLKLIHTPPRKWLFYAPLLQEDKTEIYTNMSFEHNTIDLKFFENKTRVYVYTSHDVLNRIPILCVHRVNNIIVGLYNINI